MPPDLSIVIPVHNEAANIAALLAEIREAMGEGINYEVIVADDASDDSTPEILRKLAETMPALRVVRHQSQRGQSAGVLSGVRLARAAWVATLDGDGQNDPADIPNLLAARDADDVPENLQMVTGHRANRHDTWLKRASSKTANRVRRWALRDANPDTGCGLKLFSRAAFIALPHFDHFHRFLPALIKRSGGAVLAVPVNHRPRGGGRSHYGVFNRLWIGIVDMAGVMWLQRRELGAADAADRADEPGEGE
jgi:dolichol-phosphate mannosyltransferase